MLWCQNISEGAASQSEIATLTFTDPCIEGLNGKSQKSSYCFKIFLEIFFSRASRNQAFDVVALLPPLWSINIFIYPSTSEVCGCVTTISPKATNALRYLFYTKSQVDQERHKQFEMANVNFLFRRDFLGQDNHFRCGNEPKDLRLRII